MHMLIARAKGQQVGALMDAPNCPACASVGVTTRMLPVDRSKLNAYAREHAPSMWTCPVWDAYLAQRQRFYSQDWRQMQRNGAVAPEPPKGHAMSMWAIAEDDLGGAAWIAKQEGEHDGTG
jgi:hypothetical protein